MIYIIFNILLRIVKKSHSLFGVTCITKIKQTIFACKHADGLFIYLLLLLRLSLRLPKHFVLISGRTLVIYMRLRHMYHKNKTDHLCI